MSKDSKQKKIITIICGIAIFLALVIAVVAVTQVISKKSADEEKTQSIVSRQDDFDEDNYLWATLYGQDYYYENQISTYLIIGVDDSKSDDDAYNGGMSDFLSVLVVDDTAKTYSVIQLDRDTMADILMITADGLSQQNRTMQLCTAHWYGASEEDACENTATAVSSILGEISIDYYASVPISAIGQINHVLGGVTLTVNGDFSKIDPELKNGETITLTDQQAETYVRGRKDVDDGTNIERMRRQREYLNACAKQFEKCTSEDAGFALQAYNEVKDIATSNINGNNFSKLSQKLSKYENLGIFTFEGESKLGMALDDNIEHAEFYLDEDSVVETMIKLFHLQKSTD